MSFPEMVVADGVRRQVLADHPEMMVVAFRFGEGMEGALHAHPHVQSTFVRSGRFQFSLDGETRVVEAGDSFVIPANTTHGCVCLSEGELIDCFTPRRDDFL
ncbi:MAG: cupin domain-containing protein [Pseudomonadota bacterium]